MTVLPLVLWVSVSGLPFHARGNLCAVRADSISTLAVRQSKQIEKLSRQLLRDCRNDFAALFQAGRALARAARYEEAHDDQAIRRAAARLLDRAVQLRPRNAAAWYEYGLALKKTGGMQIDAFRAINRALELADRYPDSTPPSLLADIQLQRARRVQDWVDRFRWLKDASTLSVITPSCSGLGLFCENYTRPTAFHERLRDVPFVDLNLAEQREYLVRLYQQVLAVDSSRQEAFERLAREYALSEEWETVVRLSSRQAQRATDAGFPLAVEALAHYRSGRLREADTLYRMAVSLIPDSVRRWYVDPPSGIGTVGDFWRRSRPLRLTPYNELELEYWSRVTYALLVFGDREAEVIGPETPMGDALIRYGLPRLIVQVGLGVSSQLSSGQIASVIATALDCSPGGGNAGLPPCGAVDPGENHQAGGGRWTIWTYADDQPSFIFEQTPGRRVPRYLFEGPAEAHAEQLRRLAPLTFRSGVAPHAFRLPAQVARFKGTTPFETVVSVYTLAASKQMGLPSTDSVDVGLFVMGDTLGLPSVAEMTERARAGELLPLSYRVRLAPGRYLYSAELLAVAHGVSASARDSLTVDVWSPESLRLSDLVIAHQVESRGENDPRSWLDLAIDPSRTMQVRRGANIWLVWEAYGLRAGTEGTARYDVSLALQSTQARPAGIRLLERLGVRPRQEAPAVALEWTSERRLAVDGRALEYVQVQLPEDAEGSYQFILTVKDPATGRASTAVRSIEITSP